MSRDLERNYPKARLKVKIEDTDDATVVRILFKENRIGLLDRDSLPILGDHYWGIDKPKPTHYYACHRFVDANGKKRLRYLHRVLLDAPHGVHVDHVNGDCLDNRLCNLRLCTPRENAQNRKLGKDSSCGFKGATWCTKSRKYKAQICINGKMKYLGSFLSAEIAALAYDEAATIHFGKFARLNFPVEA